MGGDGGVGMYLVVFVRKLCVQEVICVSGRIWSSQPVSKEAGC